MFVDNNYCYFNVAVVALIVCYSKYKSDCTLIGYDVCVDLTVTRARVQVTEVITLTTHTSRIWVEHLRALSKKSFESIS